MQQSSISNKEKQRQPQAGSSGEITSTSASRPSASQLVNYRFELLEADSTDYKLLRLTYLGEGGFNNKSVDFRILTINRLVDDLKGQRDRGKIIKDFLFGKIQKFIGTGSRIDDENIKRFFSSESVKIETGGVVSMDLLKAIIKAKKLQTQVGHSETAKILIEKGTDVKQADKDGLTRLHGDLVSAQMQEELNILKSTVEEIKEQQKKLIGDSKQQVDGLKSAIDQQLALESNFGLGVGAGSGGAAGGSGPVAVPGGGVGFKATLSDNINPRFMVSVQDLAEIKYIQNNPELNEYYCRMQKCFNEAFLFATIVSQGGVSIEEQSRIVNSLENISSALGDIPFASLIVNQFKYGASEISKAKTKGQQGNFSDMVATSDSIESSLLAERIARRFTASRELNEQAQNQIIANASEIKDQGRIQKIKTYLVAGARKYLTRISPNLERGFLGQELSPTNQLALSDFVKAVEFIFNKGISPEIKSNLDEKERHQKIAQEIVSKAIELEVKDYNQNNQALSNTQIAQANQGTIQGLTQTSTPTTAQMMEMMSQKFEKQLASELSEFKKQQEEAKNKIEELKQQHQRQIGELEQRLQQSNQIITQVALENQQREITLQQQEQQINRLNQQRQYDRQRIEQQFQTQQEERQKQQQQIAKIFKDYQKVQTNQDKLKKLAEIADIAPDLEITIGQGSQSKTMKLGDIMKDQKNKTNNLEQNLGGILSQIQLQFETQGQRLDQIEAEGRPSPRVKQATSDCCLTSHCTIT